MEKRKNTDAIIIILLVVLLVGVIAAVVYKSIKADAGIKNGMSNNGEKIDSVNYFNLLNTKSISEIKTKSALHNMVEEYNRRWNTTNGDNNSPFIYKYTIKQTGFEIDKIYVDCEIINENEIQFIKVPNWFALYFDIEEKIQLEKIYDINISSCILELIDIEVEKHNEFDIWKVNDYKLYEQEKGSKDYKTACIGKYIDKTIVDTVNLD